jgi:PAS domain S-box-containing protein
MTGFAVVLTALFIFFGAVTMSLSLLGMRKVLQLLSASKYTRNWQALFSLAVFFLGGYVVALALVLTGTMGPLAMLTGVIFFFGALFVYLVVWTGQLSIGDLLKTTVAKSYVEDIIKTMADTLIVVDPDLTIQTVNQATLALLGYEEHELIGQHVGMLFADKGLPWMDCSEAVRHFETAYLAKDGKKIPVVFSGSVMCDGKNEVQGMVCVARDITERKRAEEALHRQNEYLATLHDTTLGLISRLDLDELLATLISRAGQLLNAPYGFIYLAEPGAAELELKVVIGLSGQQVGERVKRGEGFAGQVWQTGHPSVADAYNMWPGRSPDIDCSVVRGIVGVPLTQNTGTDGAGPQVVGVIGLAYDAGSDRTFGDEEVELLDRYAQLASIALDNARLYRDAQRERQYFESLLLNSPAAVVIIDPRGKILSWNPTAENLFGYTQAEAVGRHLDDLIAPAGRRAEAMAYTQRAVAGDLFRAITERSRKDGTLVDVELLAVPLIVEGEEVGAFAIYHDITDLQRARQEAEAANRAKSTFLANMSHELRTPLNAIIGYSEMLAEDFEDEQGLEAFIPDLQKIRAAGKHLLSLINDVLDLSKIEAGKMELYLETFEVSRLIEDVVNTVQPLVEKNANTLEVLRASNLGTMHADLTKVRQSLFNLFSNAAKFTERGTITLGAARERVDGTDWVSFSVKDTGIGMKPEQVEKLFQPFWQAEASTARKYGGTGLGLAVTHHFCQMMGGEISVESEYTLGSTFIIRLPAEVAAHEAQPTFPAESRFQPVRETGETDFPVNQNHKTSRALRGGAENSP